MSGPPANMTYEGLGEAGSGRGEAFPKDEDSWQPEASFAGG